MKKSMHGNYNVGYGRVALHLRTLTCIHQMICASITFVNNMDSYHSPHVISQHLPPSRRSSMVYRVTLSSAFIDCLLQTDAGPWWTLQGLSLIKSQTATSTLIQSSMASAGVESSRCRLSSLPSFRPLKTAVLVPSHRTVWPSCSPSPLPEWSPLPI